MPYEFRYVRRVEFAETDMAGIMHFSNFFLFMEAAEHAFYRSLGLGVHVCLDNKTISWPRGRAECSYSNPVRLDDEIEVHLLVKNRRTSSVEYGFVLRRVNEVPPLEVAKGSMTVVCCAIDKNNGTISAVPIPDLIAAKIEIAPSHMFVDRNT